MKKSFISMLVLSLMLIPLLISLVNSSDWTQYGNSLNMGQQASIGGIKGYFDYGINTTTNTNYYVNFSNDYGSVNRVQPLVFYQNGKSFILIQNKTHIMVLNSTLLQNGILSTPNATGSLVIPPTTFLFTSTPTIFGIYQLNNTILEIKGFQYDDGSGAITQFYNRQIEINNLSAMPNGLRYDGYNKKIVFLYDTPSRFISFDTTNYIENNLTWSENALNPLIFQDVDNNGGMDYLAFNTKKLILFESTGITKFTYNISNTVFNSIQDAMIMTRTAPLSDVVIVERSACGGAPSSGNYTISVRTSTGSVVWTKLITVPYDATVNNPFCTSNAKLSIINDYNGDGKLDIAVFMDNVDIITQNQERILLYILSGVDGSTIGNVQYTFSYGVANTNVAQNILTTADMNHDNKEDFILSSRGRILIVTNLSTIINYTTGAYNNIILNCIPADIRLRNDLSIVCIGDSRTYMINSLINDTQLQGLLISNITNQTIITNGSNQGFNNIVTSTGNLFPDSSTLTTKQKLLYVLIVMIMTVFLISLVGFLHSKTIPPLLLYLMALLLLLEFVFFISIGYIGVGVLVIIILALIVVSYFKFFKGHEKV